jgi:plasmid stabilization system protein ParE
MANLVICSAAEAEYAEALTWYCERSVQAAERFDAEFALAMEAISSDPQRFPYCDERHRYYLMRHYPYQVIFRETADGLAIIAVAHTKRKPGYWANR